MASSQNNFPTSWEDHLPLPKLSFRVAAIVVFCLSILCFYNSYNGEFVYDDSEAVINNKDLLPTTPITDVFSHDFWGQKLASKTSHKSYRPLTVLTFRLNYYLAGGLHSVGFHLVNILLHAIVSVLFLHIFSILFTGYLSSINTDFNSPKASFLCAVLFTIHPVHTESVAGVVGRADLLCALLFLLSFLSYSKSCISEVNKRSYRPENHSIFWLLLSVLCCTLSTLCKEQGITVIGLCSAFDIIMVCHVDVLSLILPFRRQATQPVTNGHNNNISKQDPETHRWVKYLILRQICLFCTGVFLLVVRWRVMGSVPPTFQVHENPHSFVDGVLYRAVNYNYLYAINVWLLINPSWLCYDWSMGCVPVITSLYDVRIFVAVTFLLLLLLLLFYSLRDNTKHQRLLLLSLVFLIVPFLPGSNLFFRVGFVVAERVLYLSSAGMCMLITYGVINLSKHINNDSAIRCGVLVLIVLYTSRSMQRSAEWKNETILFSSGEKVCPLNAKVHYNIGKVSSDNGNKTEAINRYRLAVKLNPDYHLAMNNLANILKDQGQLNEAEELLTRAVTIRPEYATAWMNLGIVQSQLLKYESSEKSYLQALTHQRKFPECYFNLGNLYLKTENYVESEQLFIAALKEDKNNAKYYHNLGVLYYRWGKYDKADKSLQTALKLDPNNSDTKDNIAKLQRQRAG